MATVPILKQPLTGFFFALFKCSAGEEQIIRKGFFFRSLGLERTEILGLEHPMASSCCVHMLWRGWAGLGGGRGSLKLWAAATSGDGITFLPQCVWQVVRQKRQCLRRHRH